MSDVAPGSAPVRIAGVRLELLAARAAWRPGTATLYLADLHLGKGATFRAAGVPVPRGSSAEVLERLGRLTDELGARRIVFLGDLLHAAEGRTGALDAAVTRWRDAHPGPELVLVPGNHDRAAGLPPPGWDIAIAAPGTEDPPFLLAHRPPWDPSGRPLGNGAGGGEGRLRAGRPSPGARGSDGRPRLCGHLHPVVRLREGRGGGLRAPAFWLRGATLVLPAFGLFTGGSPVRPAPGDRVFAVGPDQVVEARVG